LSSASADDRSMTLLVHQHLEAVEEDLAIGRFEVLQRIEVGTASTFTATSRDARHRFRAEEVELALDGASSEIHSVRTARKSRIPVPNCTFPSERATFMQHRGSRLLDNSPLAIDGTSLTRATRRQCNWKAPILTCNSNGSLRIKIMEYRKNALAEGRVPGSGLRARLSPTTNTEFCCVGTRNSFISAIATIIPSGDVAHATRSDEATAVPERAKTVGVSLDPRNLRSHVGDLNRAAAGDTSDTS
jgi:hypothetical protein